MKKIEGTLDNPIGLIIDCLTYGGYEHTMSVDEDNKKPNINIMTDNGTITNVESYDIDQDQITIIDTYHKETGDTWDGDSASWCLFRHANGFGLAHEASWFGPTFSAKGLEIYIYHGNNVELFDAKVLWDDIRERALTWQLLYK